MYDIFKKLFIFESYFIYSAKPFQRCEHYVP
jgi:hypothetical protein